MKLLRILVCFAALALVAFAVAPTVGIFSAINLGYNTGWVAFTVEPSSCATVEWTASARGYAHPRIMEHPSRWGLELRVIR